jgi:putative FmdB family regulatory protein
MPIYEFECRKCTAHLEVFQKVNDKPPVKCRKCGGRLERLISAPAIQFKGAGWYVTDYAGKGKRDGKSDESSTSVGDTKKETSPKKTSDSASSTKASKSD